MHYAYKGLPWLLSSSIRLRRVAVLAQHFSEITLPCSTAETPVLLIEHYSCALSLRHLGRMNWTVSFVRIFEHLLSRKQSNLEQLAIRFSKYFLAVRVLYTRARSPRTQAVNISTIARQFTTASEKARFGTPAALYQSFGGRRLK